VRVRGHRAILFFALIAALGVSAEAVGGWQPYVSAAGRFTISMPGVPDVGDKVRGRQQITWYLLRTRDCNYMLEHTDIQSGGGAYGVPFVLDRFVEGFTREEQAIDLVVRDATFAGCQARAVEFRKDDGRQVQGYILCSNGRVYLVFTFRDPGVPEQRAYFDSFRLLQ